MNYDIFMYLYSEVFPRGLYLLPQSCNQDCGSGTSRTVRPAESKLNILILVIFVEVECCRAFLLVILTCSCSRHQYPERATYEAKLVSRTAFLFYFNGQRLEKTAPSLGPSLQKHVECLCSVKVHTHSLYGIPWPLAVVVTDIIMSLINSHLQAMHSNDVYGLRGGWDTFNMFVEGWTACVYILLHSCNLANSLPASV